ncbi:hypothetical protein [Streptomyces rubiginosohelvolus]|uniref:hypothetical protein n=1 Tax=Streptomyces rubiginosohelvolus TaxID=67362 RepID=UPI003867BB2B|nr:hypothetical protein OG475_34620 [Streptomyces rubiginosohelvolus]
MPDTDAAGRSQTKDQDDAVESGPPAPRLYSVTTRYTDQFLGGQDGPDLLCDDAVAALHFALTNSSSSPLAVTCTTSTDGRTWRDLPLRLLHADALSALRRHVKPAMYPAPVDNSRPDPRRPRAALRGLIELAQVKWLDSALHVDDEATWLPDEPTAADWVRAGRMWAAVWGDIPSESVLKRLPGSAPSTALREGLLRAEAAAVLDATALAHTPAPGADGDGDGDGSLPELHSAWALLHDVAERTLGAEFGPGTDVRTAEHRLLERIGALHPDTAGLLAATRDHPAAAGIRAAAHAYLRRVLVLWPKTAAWTEKARTAFLEDVHALRTTVDGIPPGPPETRAQAVLREVLEGLDLPAALSRHEAAALWRSHSGRGAEQAGWDATVETNRTDDLALAHTVEGTPQGREEAVAEAQRALNAVAGFHDERVTTHAARGHLHALAASLVTLDQALRTLQHGIWDIHAERRAQHDPARGPWNGYDEQRATADLTPVLEDGEARIAQLRQRCLDAANHTLTHLIPQLTDTPRDDYRHHRMRNYLAPLDQLRKILNILGPLTDEQHRTCRELRTRLNTGPRFGEKHTTAQDLAAAEKRLQVLERRYTDTQTEFALSVTLGRLFDQVRTPAPSPSEAAAAPRSSRRAAYTPTNGHDQATATAHPGPAAHGRTPGA